MHQKLFCRVIAIILLFTTIVPAKALSSTDNTSISVESITLNSENLIIEIGSGTKLKTTIAPSNATDKTIEWDTSDPTIATVDQYGNVKGLATGTAIITAKSKSKNTVTASCNVTVASLQISPSYRGVKVGDSFKISAEVQPDNLEIEWTSSNPTYATVNNDGTVTGVKGSSSTISINATIKDSQIKESVSVKVSQDEVPLKGITFDEINVSVYEGYSAQVKYSLDPIYTTQPGLIWTSSDEGIATVDNNGLITGKAASEKPILITATSEADNTIHNTISVTVLPTISVEGINGVPEEVTLNMNQGVEVVRPEVVPENATFPELIITTSNPKVATVYNNGGGIYHIVPHKITEEEGTAQAIITFKSKSNPNIFKTCNVTVKFVPTLVNKISLSKTSATVIEGDSYELTATVEPTDATNKILDWTASFEDSDESPEANELNPDDFVKIEPDADNNAKVTLKALKPTEKDRPVIITATATDGSVDKEGKPLKAEFKLTINKRIIKIEKIEIITPEGTTDEKGVMILAIKEFSNYKTYGKLEVKLTPENTTEKDIIWSSSNPNIVTVEEDGTVKALSGGTVTITAKSKDRSTIKATCSIKVLVPAEEVKIDYKAEYLALKVGKTATLTTTVLPSNTSDKKVTWKSANNEIATVTEKGVVTGVAAGETTITATAADGSNQSGTIKVVVKPADNIDVTRISISPSSATFYQYLTKQLEATISPKDATNKDIIWKSSDESIATVEGGLVSGIKGGKVTITATSVSDPTVSGSASITITPIQRQIEIIDLRGIESEVEVGKNYTLNAYIWPENATNKNLRWESSDEECAKVTKTGVVTTLKATLSVTITAYAEDGSNVEGKITFAIVEPKKPTTNQVVLSESEISLEEGDTYELTARVDLVTSGVSDELVWSSEDTSIARVSSTGRVSAVKEGETVITAALKQYPEINAKCVVSVYQKMIYIKSISLYPSTLKLTLGETYKLSYSYRPSNATNPVFYWSTNNGSVATIIDGTVYANSLGIATIYLEAMDGSNVSATCDVTVVAPAGIDGVNGDGIKVSVGNGAISVDGVNDALIEVYNLSGALIHSGTETTIDNLTAGVYIVRIGSYSTKVIVK